MKRLSLVFLLVVVSAALSAQDDLMNLLNENAAPAVNYTTATFKSTRIMNGHSIERMAPGDLDFRISHRFGRLNSGAYEFFGLDQANIRLGLEYGVLKWLQLGLGRGSYEKTFDGFAKFSVLRQSDGARVMPVSVSLFTSAALKTLKSTGDSDTDYLSDRMSYVAQILVARKFTPALSLQVMPSYIHRNPDVAGGDPADLWSVGAGGRIKLSKSISFNAEYYYVANPQDYQGQPVYNPFSAGFDVQTGGHVFQLIFTNSVAMIEKGFIGETTGQWSKGDIHFGFNISRVFTLKKH